MSSTTTYIHLDSKGANPKGGAQDIEGDINVKLGFGSVGLIVFPNGREVALRDALYQAADELNTLIVKSRSK